MFIRLWLHFFFINSSIWYKCKWLYIFFLLWDSTLSFCVKYNNQYKNNSTLTDNNKIEWKKYNDKKKNFSHPNDIFQSTKIRKLINYLIGHCFCFVSFHFTSFQLFFTSSSSNCYFFVACLVSYSITIRSIFVFISILLDHAFHLSSHKNIWKAKANPLISVRTISCCRVSLSFSS